MSGYTFDTATYLQNYRICASGDMTVTMSLSDSDYVTVRHLTREVERRKHNLYTMLIIVLSLSGLFINCCKTVTPNRNPVLQVLLPWFNQLKFKDLKLSFWTCLLLSSWMATEWILHNTAQTILMLYTLCIIFLVAGK